MYIFVILLTMIGKVHALMDAETWIIRTEQAFQHEDPQGFEEYLHMDSRDQAELLQDFLRKERELVGPTHVMLPREIDIIEAKSNS